MKDTLFSDSYVERAVLGAILIDNGCALEVFEIIKPEDFSVDLHKQVAEVMFLMSGLNQGIDLITIARKFEGDRNSKEIDDWAMEVITEVASSGMATTHANILKEKSIRRNLVKTMDLILNKSRDPNEELSTLLNMAESSVFEMTKGYYDQGLSHVSNGVNDALAFVESKSMGKITGIETGLSSFDKFTGGLQSPDYIILAGRPKMGKTALAFSIASHVSKTVPVACFSLEMSMKQLCLRMLGSEARVNTQALTSGRIPKERLSELLDPAGRLYKRSLYIDDSAVKTPMQILSQCKRMKAKKGLGLIVVDYLQLMTAGLKLGNREQEISYISRMMKRIAKELEVPIIVLSQLNRGIEQRTDKRPVASDLRESGSIEQDADMITFVYRDEIYNEDGEKGKAEWIISDYRNGAPGIIDLSFDASTTTFKNYTQIAGGLL